MTTMNQDPWLASRSHSRDFSTEQTHDQVTISHNTTSRTENCPTKWKSCCYITSYDCKSFADIWHYNRRLSSHLHNRATSINTLAIVDIFITKTEIFQVPDDSFVPQISSLQNLEFPLDTTCPVLILIISAAYTLNKYQHVLILLLHQYNTE